jgi:aminomethyltransferase
MVDFAGWSMPVQYTSIVEEHNAVRSRVGLFDISHMGRLRFEGPDALAWLDRVTTNAVVRLEEGQAQYSLMLNDSGGVIDDVLVYRLNPGYGMVCNASNREAVLAQLERERQGFNAEVVDSTFNTAMIAVQGPRALVTLQAVFDGPLSDLKYYHHTSGQIRGTNAIASRTGYTGEDGFEIVIHRDLAHAAWSELLDAGREFGIVPCGLGARDTLRFEAAMPLYGHEMDETVDPYSAGLGFAVKLEKGDFVGREALTQRRDHPQARRIGLALEGKRIARQGATVLAEGQAVGVVTSGTFSPTRQLSLAMARVEPAFADLSTHLEVDVRGRAEPAQVVQLPFYRRPRRAHSAS